MSELRIFRGRDVAFYLDGSVLFGVTEFSAAEERKVHKVREYMSASPVAAVPQGAAYRLKLHFLSVFDRQLPTDGSFRLRLVCEDEEYIYEDCVVTEYRLGAKGEKNAEAVYTLEAEKCTWRKVGEDD